MNLPFSPEEFLGIFEEYNLAVFPMQIFLLLMAGAIIFFSFKKYSGSDQLITILLAFFWFWMGVIYHLAFFTKINGAAYFFGILFILQAFLIWYFGYLKNELAFRFRRNTAGYVGAILILYALFIYPFIGYQLGHIYPASPTFGLPCPTVIFTFGVLLWTEKRFSRWLLVIPFSWSILGVSAALSLGIWEDIGLLIAGVLSTILIFLRDRVQHKPAYH